MAHFIFAARNCRKKHSTKAEGDATRKAELSPDYKSERTDTTLSAPEMAAMAADLKKKARLEVDQAVLAAHLATAYTANPLGTDSTTFQERVGKAVIQIGYGTGANPTAAKAAIVWFDLD